MDLTQPIFLRDVEEVQIPLPFLWPELTMCAFQLFQGSADSRVPIGPDCGRGQVAANR